MNQIIESLSEKFNTLYPDKIEKEWKEIEKSGEGADPQKVEEVLKMTPGFTAIDMINFGKIHDVMVTLNWHWASSAFGVPTVEDIIEEAKNLLDKAWGYREGLEHVSYETGGLRAERWIYDGVKLLTLSFVVDSFMIDYDTAKMGKDEFYGDKNVTDE